MVMEMCNVSIWCEHYDDGNINMMVMMVNDCHDYHSLPMTYVNITVDGNVYCVIHAGLPSSSSRSDVNITRFMAIDLELSHIDPYFTVWHFHLH